jgi:hypothetical protein
LDKRQEGGERLGKGTGRRREVEYRDREEERG